MKNIGYKLWAWMAIFAFIGLMTLYVFEFAYFANTLDFKGLLFRSLLAGLLVGLLLGLKFYKKGKEQVDKIRIWTACIILPIAFAPFFGSVSNRLLSFHPREIKSFEFFQEKPFAEELYGVLKNEQIKPDGYYVFVIHEGDLIRLKSKTARFTNKKSGDQIELSVKKGLWGYYVILWEA